MLTDGVDAVDPAAGLWVSVSEIARQKGISKQAVAKRVDRLVADGILTTRLGAQNAKLVNIAAFDKAVGDTTDAIRSQNGRSALAAPKTDPSDPILAREQARRVSYQAELSRLDLEERLGNLLPLAEIVAAVTECAETIVRSFDQLPSNADKVAAAVGKDGAHGARSCLRDMAFDLRRSVERALTHLAERGLAEKAREIAASTEPDAPALQ